MLEHEVRSGDCLSSIGAKHGFDWRVLWDYGPNAPLREKRKDPNILYPGDVVMIPEQQAKEETRPTGKTHRFKLKGGATKVRVRLLVLNEPRRNLPCTLDIDGRKVARTTDGDGRLEALIAPDAIECVLTVHEEAGDETYRIKLGALDPVDTPTGVQQRLSNLGYACGPVDGIVGPKTRAATKAFQADQEIKVDGIAGPVTKGRLVKAHGS